MRASPESGRPVAPGLALVFAVVGFFALAIAGLGLASLTLDADVIPVEGLGQIPGVIGMLAAGGAFAAVLWTGLRAPHPSFWTAGVTTVGAFVGEVVGVGLGALVTGAPPAAAVAASGAVAIGWPGAVVAGAALVASWGGVALVRTRAQAPRWPWEDDEES